MSTLTKQEKITEREYAREYLADILKSGDTIFTVIRSVAPSGMSRTMSLYLVKDNNLMNITYYAAHALEWRLVEVNGSRVMRVGGCGMDMGFHAVYTLSSVILNDGYAINQRWA